MSFPRYAEYKDSGIEWLGEVPAHWDVQPMLGIASERYESNSGMVENNLLSLSYGRIVEKNIDSNDGLLPESFETYQVVWPDDIVFRLTDLQNDKRSLRTAIVTQKGIITSAYLAVTPLHANARFMHHLLRACDERKVFYSMGGGLRQSMKYSDVKRLPLPVPTGEEQAAIAAFLDHETVKIDALVAEQEKLIALLKEKRQAVISHAVTKGLDPDAPMKDSGNEWLGEVPAHWEVTRIKRVVNSFGQGWSPQCEGFPVETTQEWGVLKVGCVNGGRFNSAENKRLPPELEPLPELGIVADDLLISRANTRELVGSAAVAENNYPNLLLCDKLYRVRLDAAVCLPGFLALYLASNAARGQIELAATGASSSMVNIGQSTILEMSIAIPGVDEQRALANFIDRENSRLALLTAEAEAAVKLLKERRSALISAAVTGKIDVREFAGSRASILTLALS